MRGAQRRYGEPPSQGSASLVVARVNPCALDLKTAIAPLECVKILMQLYRSTVNKVSYELNAAVEPVIEELEKELDQSITSDGVNTEN